MKRKHFVAIIVILLFVGALGIYLLNQNSQKNMAIANASNNNYQGSNENNDQNNVDLEQNKDEKSTGTPEEAEGQEQSNESIESNETSEPINNDSSNNTVENNETENNALENNESAATEVVENKEVDTNHIIINRELLIDLVGEEIYNFQGEAQLIMGEINQFVLVNKKNELGEDYVPGDLREPNVPFSFETWDEKRQLQGVAATALEQLFEGSIAAGNDLRAVSGYRSYTRQKAIFKSNSDKYGEETANQFSARPGQSEHQTGLAMDVSCAGVGFELDQSLDQTDEGKWLLAHAYEYGFIIRYPKDKTEITGYMYEPWHLRYVGLELAAYLQQENLTLDEFYEGLGR